MSKLMIVLGILAMAIGVAAGVLGYVAPGQMQVAGLTIEVAAILLIGGILAIGLGGLIGVAQDQRRAFRDLAETLVARTDRTAERFSRTTTPLPPEMPPAQKPVPSAKPEALVAPEPEPAAAEPKTPIFSGSVRSLDQARERAGLKAGDTKTPSEQPVVAEAKFTTRETIIAIEKAKSDLETAIGVTPESPTTPPTPPAPPDEAPQPSPSAPETLVVATTETELDIAPAEGEEEQLYVMEEKLIQGRPARVLSDGTVEAETDEGWMRFENLEHLEEYLEAMSPAKG